MERNLLTMTSNCVCCQTANSTPDASSQMAAQRRLLRELGALGTEPLEGIACWGSADDPSLVEASALVTQLAAPRLPAHALATRPCRPPPGQRALVASLALFAVAALEGPGDTPYAGGQFRMEVRIPPRYPFEPPIARFLTPVYHPNIDKRSGTICASVLKMPPKVSRLPWRRDGARFPTVASAASRAGSEPQAWTSRTRRATGNRPWGSVLCW